MTDKPSDAELKAMWRLHAADIGGIFYYARAVLAKWGTPAPVEAEPVARLVIGKTKGGVSLTHMAVPAAFQLQEGIYALYTAPQPVARGPLTRQQLREAFYSETACTLGGDVDFAEKVCRGVEKAHGIKGGQHGTESST